MSDDDEYKKARQYAFRRLAAQAYHSSQLKKLMVRKLFSPMDIEKVLKECVELGFLNDPEWFASFVRSRSKKESRRGIMAKLRAKGIIVEEISISCEEEKTAIKELVEKRSRSKNLQDGKEKQKLIGSLLRKGFSFDSIREVLQELYHLS